MRGQEPQFDATFQQHFDAVWRFVARRLPRSDVDDVVSETFVVAWRRRAEVREDFARAWLYGVARRQIANRLRQSSRQSRLLHRLRPLSESETPSADDAVLSAAIDPDSALGKAWATLRSSDQEVLLLEAWEQLSAPEVARVLGISEVAARQRISRARRAAADAWFSSGETTEK